MKTLAKVLASLSAVLVVTAIWWQLYSGESTSKPTPEIEVPSQTPFDVITTQDPVAEPEEETLPVVVEEASTPSLSDVHAPEAQSHQGVGLTPMEQHEEEIASLLFNGDYDKADALYESFKVQYPEAALTARYPFLKEKVIEEAQKKANE